ncbi:MAG: type II secretion system protein GspK [Pirellulaceae bacterium]|nr:type II secretion system protein GspK [Pirellulaceae bacterium]
MSKQASKHRPVSEPRRRAIVLMIVLVVIVPLSLAAYTFSDLMLTHRHAALVHGKRLQARMLIDSGVEAVLQYLSTDDASQTEAGGHYDNPLYFQNMVVIPETDADLRASFTVLAPMPATDGMPMGPRYGLEDESVRLNLNMVLLADKIEEGASRNLLMSLPGMSEEIADAILDWMDEDDEAREYGAELDYYSSLEPAPYAPRNGPLQTVEELLLVAGMTPQLLFGIDSNRNGMVDGHEMSSMMGGTGMAGTANVAGASAAPNPAAMAGMTGMDASAMASDRGWSSYLTIYSAERNTNALGEPRIYLNGDDLQQLHDDLSAVLSEEAANFIVAYRIYGPTDESGQTTSAESLELDLSQSPKTQITQVLELIGAKVQAGSSSGGGRSSSGSGQSAPIVSSPYADDPLAMASYLPQLMDNCTVNESESIPGRLNINQAPAELLVGIPGITEEIVDAILNSRTATTEEGDESRDFETWLLVEGLVTLDEMKSLSPFISAGGNAFRAQIVGYFQGGGPSARAEVIFDATTTPPRVLFWRDISHLGRGYALDMLGVDLIDEF